MTRTHATTFRKHRANINRQRKELENINIRLRDPSLEDGQKRRLKRRRTRITQRLRPAHVSPSNTSRGSESDSETESDSTETSDTSEENPDEEEEGEEEDNHEPTMGNAWEVDTFVNFCHFGVRFCC